MDVEGPLKVGEATNPCGFVTVGGPMFAWGFVVAEELMED